MDRQHLDRLGVGLQPPAALLVARLLLGLGDPPPQPRRQRGRAELLGRRRGVQELADVAQVGEPALAVDGLREHAPGRPSTERDRLGQRGDARARAARAPSGAGGGGRPPTRPRPRRRPARRASRGTTSAPPRARAAADVGRSIASSSRSHSRAGAVPNTLPAPLITAGTPTASSASRTSAASRLVRTSTATWPGRTRRRARAAPSSSRTSISAPEASSRDEVGGEVVGDVLARRRRLARSPAAWSPTPGRRGGRRGPAAARSTGAPDRRGVAVGRRRAHRAVDDALVAELRAAEQRVVGVDQPLVAAPVDVERRRASAAVAAASR